MTQEGAELGVGEQRQGGGNDGDGDCQLVPVSARYRPMGSMRPMRPMKEERDQGRRRERLEQEACAQKQAAADGKALPGEERDDDAPADGEGEIAELDALAHAGREPDVERRGAETLPGFPVEPAGRIPDHDRQPEDRRAAQRHVGRGERKLAQKRADPDERRRVDVVAVEVGRDSGGLLEKGRLLRHFVAERSGAGHRRVEAQQRRAAERGHRKWRERMLPPGRALAGSGAQGNVL